MIYVESGTLFLSKCYFTHNLFYKTKGIPSAVYLNDETNCVINDCYFKGSEMIETNGITIINSSISIKNSIFTHY